MGGLPALSIQPIQQESLLSKLGKMQQLKGQQQGIQEGQLDIQAKQQEQKDQQTIMQVLGMHNGDLESALPELASKVTAKTFLGLQKAAVETKKSAAELDNKMLENHKLRSDAILGVTGEALKMAQQSPELYAQNWPAIAAKVSEIDPNIGKHVDLSKPVPPEMLQQYGLLFQTQSTALAKEAESRAAAEEQRKAAEAPVKLETDKANLQLKQQELSEGGKTDIDKYISNYFKEHNLQPTAANWAKAHKAYTDETKTDPGVARAMIYAANRPVQIIDPNNPNQVKYDTAGNAIKAGAATPASASFQTNKAELKSELPKNIGNQKVAFNTAMQHADLLENAARALNNGDQNTINSLKNRFAKEFGATGPINAQVIANAYSREITAMLSKGHITDSEIGSAGATTDVTKMSLPQTLGVLKAYRALSQSKLNMLNKQITDTQNKSQGKPASDQQPSRRVIDLTQ